MSESTKNVITRANNGEPEWQFGANVDFMGNINHVDEMPGTESAFAWPRNFLNNRFVYLVVSQRARGLSVGINLNPDKRCNFKCVYCEVDREEPPQDLGVDLAVMSEELKAILKLVAEKRIGELPGFSRLPPELLELKEVALSGDGEPTLCPKFASVLHEVLFHRASGPLPFFKTVVITNTAGLPLPEVSDALRMLTSRDEIWVKLDAGTQEYMDKVNVPDLSLDRVMENILTLGQRPIVVQSLFPLYRGEEPSQSEIEQYAQRLNELKARGARIALVQIYSAHRPPHLSDCAHLPLNSLLQIARHVRAATGLEAEVF